jgi:competence protein ComEC
MRLFSTLAFALFVTSGSASAQSPPSKPLQVYVIDVEGGQSTLLVSPTGQSLLIDTGWPGFEGRDAARITAAMKAGGVARIDYLLVTHYHTDHVGGVPQLAASVPIGTFIDHGATVEDPADPGYTAYLKTRAAGKHLEVKPGDTIPVAGLKVTVVSSAGATLKTPLGRGSGPNALCADYKAQPDDSSENARSVGVVIEYGAFRMLDLGDLTWNTEHGLACPSNQIGTVDVYLTTHHGNQQSGLPALVHAAKPRVAIMNNGATKGGSPAAWRIVRSSPGLQDFWQLHTAIEGGHDTNAPEQFIANLDEKTANTIKVDARADGSFTVTNSRNGLTKSYQPTGGSRP